MDVPEEVIEQLTDIQVCQTFRESQQQQPSIDRPAWLPAESALPSGLQSALDDVEGHLQPFLEAGPKEITAQVIVELHSHEK